LAIPEEDEGVEENEALFLLLFLVLLFEGVEVLLVGIELFSRL